MAINKVVNRKTSSHGAMRNAIEYVLRDGKIREGYVDITGPYSADTINYDDVYHEWLNEKRLWNKDSGRMYAHNIISFHKDEIVTPAEVLEIGQQFADKFFSGHQCVIGVHQDKDHLHCHILTNTVSYIDGLKLHQTKHDLQKQKDFTNGLCLERGLSIAEKGRHFDGTEMEVGEITAWNKDKYNLLMNESKKSFVAECAIAVMESVPLSASRDEFISEMAARGWSVQWKDKRKHIVFKDESGNKVRDTNLSKTFSMDISKEALNNEFERQNTERIRKRELDDAALNRYYAELESAISGTYSSGETIGYHPTAERTTGTRSVGASISNENDERETLNQGGRLSSTSTEIRRNGGSISSEDFGSFIASVDAKEQSIEDAVESSISNRNDERETFDQGGRLSNTSTEIRRNGGSVSNGDFGSYLAELDAKEQNVRDAVESSVANSQNDRGTISHKEDLSIATAEQRRIAEQKRLADEKRTRSIAKSLSHSRGYSR